MKMNNDETAQDFERAVAMMEFEIDREWLLNPYRPWLEKVFERFDFDDEGREAFIEAFRQVAERLIRGIN